MTAMELEACKQELIKEINAADSFDEIRRIAQKLIRSLRPGSRDEGGGRYDALHSERDKQYD
jgi:hypothetical protein